MPMKTSGYAAMAPGAKLQPFTFERRDVGDHDVQLKVLYCGICHSDIHLARDEWAPGTFPMVPGHEIVGVVTAVGKAVTKVKVGDAGAIGCLVGSCRTCESCAEDLEQYCSNMVLTYNSKFPDGTPTYGGYSKDIVCNDHFICRVPESLRDNLAGVAPLLCAGITTYSPMKKWGMNKPGKKIGVIGLGGLGHMAVKFGVSWGNEITVISTSPSKKTEALDVLKAHNFVCSNDDAGMASKEKSLDFLIDTVSATNKPVEKYLSLLKRDGVLVTVGLPPHGYTMPVPAGKVIMQRLSVAGSLIGGLKETQEMLNFCGEKKIFSMVEVIKPSGINEAFERVVKSDVRYRFSIDVQSENF